MPSRHGHCLFFFLLLWPLKTSSLRCFWFWLLAARILVYFFLREIIGTPHAPQRSNNSPCSKCRIMSVTPPIARSRCVEIASSAGGNGSCSTLLAGMQRRIMARRWCTKQQKATKRKMLLYSSFIFMSRFSVASLHVEVFFSIDFKSEMLLAFACTASASFKKESGVSFSCYFSGIEASNVPNFETKPI